MTLLRRLNSLKSSGLIRLAQAQPELEYAFRHALSHDAAYDSLVKADRRHLYRIVGETLERLYADRLDELAPLLGQHFDEAGDAARALRSFTRAGDAASHVYALPEAIGHYTRAIELAARASGGGEPLADLFVKRGQAYHSNARWDEAWAIYLEMEHVARARGDRALELASLVERALLRAVYGPLLDPAQAETLCQHALTLAHELGDRAAEARSLWVRMRANTQAHGDPRQAIADGERSLALARELGLSEQLAYTLNDIQYAYRNAGQIEQALAALAEARDLWRANGNQHMLADNLNQTAFFHLYQSDFDAALAFTNEALAISRPTHNAIQHGLTSFIIGQIHFERGEFTRSLEVLEDGVLAQVASGMGIPFVIGSVYAASGLVDRAIDLTQTALNNIEATGLMSVFGPSTLGALVRLWLLKRNVPVAEALILRARQIVKPGFTMDET